MIFRSLLVAALILIAGIADATTQTTYTGPFSQTVTTTTIGTASCTVPTSTTLDCTLSPPLQQNAGMTIGPMTTGSPQTGGSGTAPVVTSFTCNAVLPVANGVNVTLLAGGACGYTAKCAGVACTGVNAITGWAITSQSTANSFSIVSGTGILQGGSAAAAVTAATYTVTVTATNSTGTSPGVTQSVVVANTIPTVASHSCSINLPVTNGVNVSPTCSYSALCDSQTCVSPYALTNWAITSQSVTNGFSITSAGVLQGGSGAASVVVGSPTVTITATNGAGTSSGVTQTVNVSANPGGVAPVVTALTCNISSPVTNGSNVARTQNNGPCTYSATCSGGTCTGGNAITGWTISAQSCASCYSITSAGVLQGGTNAANVATEADTVTVTATNAVGTSPGVSQPVNAYADGISGAPSATIQYSTLLNSYGANRPPWNVAGVDYAVGYPTSTTLKDPASGTLPSGVSRSGHTFTVSGNNVTLDSWDFGLENGWSIVPNNGVSNLTISNNHFLIGSNLLQPLWTEGNVVNGLTFINNVVDYNAKPFFLSTTGLASGQTVLPMASTAGVVVGMTMSDVTTTNAISTSGNTGGTNTTVSSINPNVSITLSTATIGTVHSSDSIGFQWAPQFDVPGVSITMSGTYVVKYNWFKNSLGENWQTSPSGSGSTLNMQYNLFDSTAYGFLTLGTHGDIVQIFNTSGSIATFTTKFNTISQPTTAVASLGFQFCSAESGATIGVWTEQYNTFPYPAAGSQNSYGMACINTGNVTTSVSLQNNYVDVTGMEFGYYCAQTGCGGTSGGATPTLTVSGNKCLTTGATPVNSNPPTC